MEELTDTKNENMFDTLKKGIKYSVKCPICNQNYKLGPELGYLRDEKNYPFAHIHMHGNPIHGLVVYIDKQLAIRGVEGCNSIEINQDGTTFQQMLRKWSNPF